MKCLEYLSTAVVLCSFCLLPACLACTVSGETLPSCEWSSWALTCQGCCEHMNEYRATKYRTKCCDAEVADNEDECKTYCNVTEIIDTAGGSCSSYCVGAKECGGSGTNTPFISSTRGSTNTTQVNRYTAQTSTTKTDKTLTNVAFQQSLSTTKNFAGGTSTTNTRTTSRISHTVQNTHSSKTATVSIHSPSTYGTAPAFGSNTFAIVSDTASFKTTGSIQKSSKTGTSPTLGFDSDSIVSKQTLTKTTTNRVVPSSRSVTAQTKILTNSVTASNISSTGVAFAISPETRTSQAFGLNSNSMLSSPTLTQATKTNIQELSTISATEAIGLSSRYRTTTKILTSMISEFINKSPASFFTNGKSTENVKESGLPSFQVTTLKGIRTNTPKATNTFASSSSSGLISNSLQSVTISSLYQTNKNTIISGTNKLLNTLMNKTFTTVAKRTATGVKSATVLASKSSIKHSVSDKTQGSTSSATLIADSSSPRQTFIRLSTLSTSNGSNNTKSLPNTAFGFSSNATTTKPDPSSNIKTLPSVFDSTRFSIYQDTTGSYNVVTDDRSSSLSHNSNFTTKPSIDGDIGSVSNQVSPSESTQPATKLPFTTPATSDIFQRELNSQSSEKLNETSKTEVSGSGIKENTGKISTTMLIGAGSGALLLLLLLLLLFICCKKKKPEAGKIKKKKKISQIVPIDEKLYLKQKQAVEF